MADDNFTVQSLRHQAIQFVRSSSLFTYIVWKFCKYIYVYIFKGRRAMVVNIGHKYIYLHKHAFIVRTVCSRTTRIFVYRNVLENYVPGYLFRRRSRGKRIRDISLRNRISYFFQSTRPVMGRRTSASGYNNNNNNNDVIYLDGRTCAFRSSWWEEGGGGGRFPKGSFP